MKKNGFTLVELLAVILILAIIALIAVPQVINLINSSKEQSNEIGIQNYVRAIETAVMNKDLDMESKNLNGVYSIIDDGKKIQSSDNIIDIDYDGKEITLGKVTIKDYKVIALGVEQDNKYIIYEDGKIVYNGEKQSPVSFASDSWETISLNVKVGNIGVYETNLEENTNNKKEVSLREYTNQEENSNGLYTVRIANTSTPEECSTEEFSQTACGFVVEFEDIITTHNMNPSGKYKDIQYSLGWNVDGYPASSMYKFINEEKDDTVTSIYESLSTELKDVIIDTKVVSSHGSKDITNFISTDKLYLLSTKEVWGKEGLNYTINHDTAEMETKQLDYYKNKRVVLDSYKYFEVIKKYNGSANSWWLRSASTAIPSDFYFVNSQGSWGYQYASDILGIAPAFRIG